MQLLIIDQFSEPGGAQQCLRELVPAMVRRGWDLTFAAPGKGSVLEDLQTSGVRCESLDGGSYKNGSKSLSDFARYGVDIARAIRRLRNVAPRQGPDLIYINGPRMLPVCLGFRCPAVFHAHSVVDKRYARMVAEACFRTRRVQVVATSRFAVAPLASFLADSRWRVVYTGVPDQGFQIRAPAARRRVGILGRIAPEKGHLDFVAAARILSREDATLEFVVFGSSMISASGFEHRVRAAARELPIRFAGWTHDVAAALHEIDVLAVPSDRNEAAGRVIVEAFSAGTPVVAYPSGGIPELIRTGCSGLLTETAGPDSLARCIRTLLSQPGLRPKIIEQARQEWSSRFRLERFQQEMCDFIESAAAHRI